MSKRILFVSSGRLRALGFDGQLGPALEFRADERGLTDFSSYLAQNSREPVYVLVDFVEEEFREDTVPHVLGGDRRALVRTRLGRLFRDATYANAMFQGRESEGRRDDRYLFTALIRPDLLAPWMGQLSKHKVPVAGVYSLPLLTGDLLKSLKIAGQHTLVVSLQSSGGLRQTFFQDGKLRISRLAILPDPSPDKHVGLLLAEVERLRRYLNSLRMLPADGTLDVYILGSERVRAELERQSPSSISLRHHVLNLQDVARQVGIKGEYQTRFSDRIFAHLLARRAPANQYAPEVQTRYFTLHRARRACIAVSVIALIGGLGWSAATFVDALVSIQDSQSALRQAAFYVDRYERARTRLPRTPDPTPVLRQVVDGAAKLSAFETTPLPMMRVLSLGLDAFPEVRLGEIKWWVSARLASEPRQDSDLDRALKRRGEPVVREEPGVYQLASVKARIAPFDGDYRQALATVRRFAESLRQIPGVEEVVVESLPLDIGPEATLSGTTEAAAGSATAVFELRVALKRSGGIDETG